MKCSILFATFVLLSLSTSTVLAQEVCGNGADDDGDGLADDTCWSNAVMGVCENPMSCRTTGDVSPKTGSLTYQLVPDLSPIVARGPKFEFRRTYMSKYTPPATNFKTAMGTRWHHNFMSWVELNGTVAVVHLPTGQDVRFTASGAPTGGYQYYAPQAGFHLKHLRQATASPNNWELRTLTGETYIYNWSSPLGKLIEIRDPLTAPNTPNTITITYFTAGADAGQIDRIDDATGRKRFKFTYTSGMVTKVEYQTVNAGTPTTQTDIRYVYNGTNPTTVQSTTNTIQTNVYNGSGYLTTIEDGASKDIIGFEWVAATAGMNARITTGEGGIAYEFVSGRSGCVGSTVLYFNLANTTSCNVDADCGGTLKCGGKTGAGATGRCYRAARCLGTNSSSGEDVITTVSALGTCTGACAPTAEYAWSGLNLIGIKLADNNWTSFTRNSANGLPDITVEGDNNSNATDGSAGAATWYFYDSNFPGRVTEERTLSSIKGAACDSINTAGCKRTSYAWGSATGLLDSRQERGFTYDATNTIVSYDYTTAFTYDSLGRTTLIDGPLTGGADNDKIEFTYRGTGIHPHEDEYPYEVKQKKDASNYLVTAYNFYDAWGHPENQKDPDGSFTCRDYDVNRGWLIESREAMNGQTSCNPATVHSSDLITAFERDTFGRLTKSTLPLGDCQHKEYDSFGRLTDVKLRDDCVAGNAGNTQTYTYDLQGLGIKGEYKDSAGTVRLR